MLAILNSLGAGEAIAILVIALIVLGPEKLPDAIRKFGNIYGELRRMSHGFQSELRDAFDEPMRELRGTAQMMQDAVNEPMQAVKSELKAPVAGGGNQAKPAEKPPAAADDGATPPTDGSVPSTDGAVPSTDAPAQVADEVQAPVDEPVQPVDDTAQPTRTDEVQAPVDEVDAPADEPAPPPADDDQPVLAQAGLMVSEPELPLEQPDGAADDGAEAAAAADTSRDT